MNNNIFTNISSFTHNLLGNVITLGDYVIDATIGNGNDTLFLAKSVGSNGRVYGFDVQVGAIENTSSLLNKHGLLEQVKIIHAGHENMTNFISTPVKAVMFNLGYLPKGNHQIITLPDTTISALRQAMELLLPGGVITITVYPGHQGGEIEQKAVEKLLKTLDKKVWDTLVWSFLNRSSTAPYLMVIYRRGG